MIHVHIQWVRGGYTYRTTIRKVYGWRQIGIEAFGVMDDFGNLVFVDRPEP